MLLGASAVTSRGNILNSGAISNDVFVSLFSIFAKLSEAESDEPISSSDESTFSVHRAFKRSSAPALGSSVQVPLSFFRVIMTSLFRLVAVLLVNKG